MFMHLLSNVLVVFRKKSYIYIHVYISLSPFTGSVGKQQHQSSNFIMSAGPWELLFCPVFTYLSIKCPPNIELFHFTS